MGQSDPVIPRPGPETCAPDDLCLECTKFDPSPKCPECAILKANSVQWAGHDGTVDREVAPTENYLLLSPTSLEPNQQASAAGLEEPITPRGNCPAKCTPDSPQGSCNRGSAPDAISPRKTPAWGRAGDVPGASEKDKPDGDTELTTPAQQLSKLPEAEPATQEGSRLVGGEAAGHGILTEAASGDDLTAAGGWKAERWAVMMVRRLTLTRLIGKSSEATLKRSFVPWRNKLLRNSQMYDFAFYTMERSKQYSMKYSMKSFLFAWRHASPEARGDPGRCGCSSCVDVSCKIPDVQHGQAGQSRVSVPLQIGLTVVPSKCRPSGGSARFTVSH
jgi:hypothetical protein